MAITFYTGIPRSGKTLKAVALIYDTFVAPNIPKTGFLDKTLEKVGLDKKSDCPYLFCYTNINQFNYEIDERIKPFDFDDFLSKLQILHSMYILKSSDDELIEKSKEFDLYKSLFVIDEAHNFFNKKNDCLIWWLSYHGHLYHEIILITQHLSLIPKEFTQFSEYFYKAVPQRFRFSKNTFKYLEYSGRELYKNQRIGTVSLKLKPEYFNLYVSGSKKEDKPIIYKYIIFLIVLIILALISFFRFTSSLDEVKKEESKIDTTNMPDASFLANNEDKTLTPGQTVSSSEIAVNLKLFKLICFENFCYYKNNNSTLEIPIKILTPLMLELKAEHIFVDEQRNNKVTMYFLADSEKFSFLETSKKEKKESSSNLPNLMN